MLLFSVSLQAQITNGTYQLTARHSSKALEVSNGSTRNGANIQQLTANGTTAQQWVLTATTDGYYKIENKGSNKALQVASSGTADGDNVIQWRSTGSNSQQWKIEATTDGFYRLLNRNSGKALEVAGSSLADGANVQQWTYGEGNHQQWKVEPVSGPISDGVTLSIDKNTRHQTIDGFGFFGARDVWWGSSDPAHFYSEAWLDKIVSDLGISIWRNELYPHNPPTGNTTPNQDAHWDEQRPMVQALKAKADQYGVDMKVILSVWSPPGEFKWESEFSWAGDENATRGP
ncbi:MAG: RICIN domain-containing protein, partial [Bacteroidetes bacterium]|nr:RICIN domain-containing protein [Bacteroidota bacterium]